MTDDPFLPLTRGLLDRVCPPDRASAIAPFQPEGASIRWGRVSGGRAVHAFAPRDTVPLCGADPVRPDGSRARWIDTGAIGTVYLPRRWTISGSLSMRAESAHKRCQRLAQQWAAHRWTNHR